MWSFHSVEYYLTIKRNEILIQKWSNISNFVLFKRIIVICTQIFGTKFNSVHNLGGHILYQVLLGSDVVIILTLARAANFY